MSKIRVVTVRVAWPYVLDVTFDDGTRREVDLESELWGEVFASLRDPEIFAQVSVDPQLGTIVWPNGADLAPEFLYYGEETPYGRVEYDRPAEAASAKPASD